MTKFLFIFFMVFLTSSFIHALDVDPIEIDGNGGGYDFRPFKLSNVLNKNEIKILEILCKSFEFQEKEKNLFGETRLRINDQALENNVPLLVKIMSPLCFLPISQKTYYFLDEAHYIKGDENEYFTYSFKSKSVGRKFEIDLCLYSIRGYHYASFSKEAIDLCRDFMLDLEESDLNGIGELPFFMERKIYWTSFLQEFKELQEPKELKSKSDKGLANLKKLNNNRMKYKK